MMASLLKVSKHSSKKKFSRKQEVLDMKKPWQVVDMVSTIIDNSFISHQDTSHQVYPGSALTLENSQQLAS